MRSGAEGSGVWGSGDAYDEGLCAEGGGIGDKGGNGEGVGVKERLMGGAVYLLFGRSWEVLRQMANYTTYARAGWLAGSG